VPHPDEHDVNVIEKLEPEEGDYGADIAISS
jgi:hypothetical protein